MKGVKSCKNYSKFGKLQIILMILIIFEYLNKYDLPTLRLLYLDVFDQKRIYDPVKN